jgi:glycosyltransferase involved in cell wall biosynthesis
MVVTQTGSPPLAPPARRGPRPRHLCVVTETYPPEVNGVALTLGRLVEGLRARGHAVSVVRPRQGPEDRAPGPEDPTLTLVPGLPLPGYPILRFGFPAGARLRRRWSARRPDAIYVATEGPLGWSAVSAARQLGIPVRGGFHTNFHGYAAHYRAGFCRDGVVAYLRSFHNRTDGTLVPTVELRDHLRAAGFRRLAVLGRGVDARLYTPARRSAALRQDWGAGETDPVALYVGRVAPEKNVELAVQAHRAMRAVDGAARLVVVGDGPSRAALQAALPEVQFVGALTGEALAAHYASADVFLFPSETETFGNVTLEAMASGLAVVAYDYAAARAHIESGWNGVRVPYRDTAAFVAAAAALTRDRDRREAIRSRARGAVTHLHWDHVVARFETWLDAGGQAETETGAARPEQEVLHE